MQNNKINKRFENIISPDLLKNLLNNVKFIAYRNTIKFQEYFPNITSDDGIYRYSNTFYDSWHGGWWTGIFNMAYEVFSDEKFRHYAENLTSRFYSLIKNNRIVHSEMGFIYLPICTPDIKFNQSSEAAEAIILAAEYMLEAFSSFHGSGVVRQYRTPDEQLFQSSTLINTYIMRLAAKISGNSKFYDMAQDCDENVLRCNIYDSGKCFMETVVNRKTGTFTHLPDSPAQYGFSKHGDYARGYAWAALGLALHYAMSGEKIYEEKLYNIISYFSSITDGDFLVAIPGDEKGRKIKDTTSLAIFVCSFCEIIKKLSKTHPRYNYYYNLLDKCFNVMISYSVDLTQNKQGFLEKGLLFSGSTVDRKTIKNSCNICGDYFYLEALMHMTEGFESYWNIDNLFIKRQEALS